MSQRLLKSAITVFFILPKAALTLPSRIRGTLHPSLSLSFSSFISFPKCFFQLAITRSSFAGTFISLRLITQPASNPSHHNFSVSPISTNPPLLPECSVSHTILSKASCLALATSLLVLHHISLYSFLRLSCYPTFSVLTLFYFPESLHSAIKSPYSPSTVQMTTEWNNFED